MNDDGVLHLVNKTRREDLAREIIKLLRQLAALNDLLASTHCLDDRECPLDRFQFVAPCDGLACNTTGVGRGIKIGDLFSQDEAAALQSLG